MTIPPQPTNNKGLCLVWKGRVVQFYVGRENHPQYAAGCVGVVEFPAPVEGARVRTTHRRQDGILSAVPVALTLLRLACCVISPAVIFSAGLQDLVTPLAHKQEFYPDQFISNVIKARPASPRSRRLRPRTAAQAGGPLLHALSPCSSAALRTPSFPLPSAQWAKQKAQDHAEFLVAQGVLADETEKTKMAALFNAFAALERPVRCLRAVRGPRRRGACLAVLREGLCAGPEPLSHFAWTLLSPSAVRCFPSFSLLQCRTCRLCNKFRLVTAKELEMEVWSCKDNLDKKVSELVHDMLRGARMLSH